MGFQATVAEVTNRDQRWNEDIQRNTSILQAEPGLKTLKTNRILHSLKYRTPKNNEMLQETKDWIPEATYPGILLGGGGGLFNKIRWGPGAARTGIWGR
jgi:hypothetical protein